jgi:hypothetical protein
MSTQTQISGHCPQCGAPILLKTDSEGDSQPVAQFSCNCREQRNASQNKPMIKLGVASQLFVK